MIEQILIVAAIIILVWSEIYSFTLIFVSNTKTKEKRKLFRLPSFSVPSLTYKFHWIIFVPAILAFTLFALYLNGEDKFMGTIIFTLIFAGHLSLGLGARDVLFQSKRIDKKRDNQILGATLCFSVVSVISIALLMRYQAGHLKDAIV